ncbi:sensor domain-containing diguanylate cyclase [Thalassotalea montiporae]
MLSANKFILEQTKENVPLNKWQKTINLMSKLYQVPSSFIVQYTEQGYQVVIASQQEENPYPAGSTIPTATNIFCKKVVESHQLLYVQNATELEEWQTNPEVSDDGYNSYLGMPINWPDGKPFGTICVMDLQKTDYDNNHIELLSEFRSVIEDDLEIIDNYDKMQQIAMVDPLTNIHNRRAFMLLAEQRFKLAKRVELLLGVLFIDADNFKQLNDKYGHDIGDKVLISIAESIKANIRESDILARIGGDEFACVLQINHAEDLATIAEKISEHYQQANRQLALPTNTISIGSVVAEKNKTLDELICIADQAMYQVKADKKR